MKNCGGILFITIEEYHSVLLGDTISTLEGVQYYERIPSVYWRVFSAVGNIISTFSVLMRVFSTFSDIISTL